MINVCPSGICVSLGLALFCGCRAQSTQSHCDWTVLWAGVISLRARYSRNQSNYSKKRTIQPKCHPQRAHNAASLSVFDKNSEKNRNILSSLGQKKEKKIIMRKEKKITFSQINLSSPWPYICWTKTHIYNISLNCSRD